MTEETLLRMVKALGEIVTTKELTVKEKLIVNKIYAQLDVMYNF